MNTSIENFISNKRIALAGASRSGQKFGNMAHKELKARGYDVALVHPQATEIDGAPCYPNLAAVRDQVDGVLVCLPASQAGQVLHEAADIGLRKVWLQQGAETPELLALGRELELDLVTGKCILMYAQPVRSFHWCHRAVVKLMGQL
jgi:predicted CoA-binding protein